MEYKERGHIALYMLDLISLLLAVGFIGFAVYLFPYLFLHIEYTVPQFVVTVAHWYERNHDVTGMLMASLILLPFIVSSALFFFLAKVATTYLETHEEEPGVPHTEPMELALHDIPGGQEPEPEPLPIPETRRSTKPVIIVSVLLVLFLVFFVASEYFITAKLLQ